MRLFGIVLCVVVWFLVWAMIFGVGALMPP